MYRIKSSYQFNNNGLTFTKHLIFLGHVLIMMYIAFLNNSLDKNALISIASTDLRYVSLLDKFETYMYSC